MAEPSQVDAAQTPQTRALAEAIGAVVCERYARKMAASSQAGAGPRFSPTWREGQSFAQGIAAYKNYAATSASPMPLERFMLASNISGEDISQYKERREREKNDAHAPRMNAIAAIIEARTGFFNLSEAEYAALKTTPIPMWVAEEDADKIAALKKCIENVSHQDFMQAVQDWRGTHKIVPPPSAAAGGGALRLVHSAGGAAVGSNAR